MPAHPGPRRAHPGALCTLRAHARLIHQAALRAVDGRTCVRNAVHIEGKRLDLGGRQIDLQAFRRVIVLGAGKASVPMAIGLEDVLGDAISDGLCITRTGYGARPRTVRVLEAAHPVPDARTLSATRALVSLLTATQAGDLILFVLSGGASAMLEALPSGVSLCDLVNLNELLLRSGAPIEEVNTVRRAISCIKGGGLGRLLPRGVHAEVLVLSDVIGNSLETIGSAPFVPAPPGLARNAHGVLVARALWDRTPPTIRARLEQRVHACEAKAGEDVAKGGGRTTVPHLVIGDHRQMARAAAAAARELGYETTLLEEAITGEARKAGEVLAELARRTREPEGCGARAAYAPLPGERTRTVAPGPRSRAFIGSGETTVTVRGTGRGGRNQEAALAFAVAAEGLKEVLALCAASDGRDGDVDASGAFADGDTSARARAMGLDARAFLENNDAFSFFDQINDLLESERTGTNTNDLFVLLVGEHPTS